jgi:transposase
MAGKTISMSKLKQIIRHRENHMALQAISKTVGISRNTVKKYLQLIAAKGHSYAELLEMEDFELDALLEDPDEVSVQRYQELEVLFPYFKKELSRTGVNRWLLWGEYKQKHPDGYSYSQFCDHYKQWGSAQSGSMHMEHSPGDKLFIDFTGDKLSIVDPVTGEVTGVEVYVATLGYSQYTYVEAVLSQKKRDFIQATENALYYLGGVPKALVPDNLKSAVTKADKYEPLVNADFLDFANHYGCTVYPARPEKPQDKSLVEKSVSTVYTRIYAPLRNRAYHDLATLNQDIRSCLDVHNDTYFQRRAISRKELFEQEEQEHLRSLAPERYEPKEYKMVTVMKTSHICIGEDKHYYSVPFRFIGKKVKLAYSRNYVSVFYSKERIAHHKRNLKQHGYTSLQEHMPSSHRFVSDWNPDRFLQWASAISPEVYAYINRILENYPYPEQAYRSCVGILSLDKKVGRERLINSVKRASEYGLYNFSVIKRILQSGLDCFTTEEEKGDDAIIEHDNIRGADTYQ